MKEFQWFYKSLSMYLFILFLRVVFGDVLHTTQLFMRDVTAIEPGWLEELAPHYFHKVTER